MTNKYTKEEMTDILLDSEELPEELREKVKDGKVKVKFASNYHIQDLEEEIEKIWEVLEINPIFVSDQAILSDFEVTNKELKQLEKELDIGPIEKNEYIYLIAQRIRNAKK